MSDVLWINLASDIFRKNEFDVFFAVTRFCPTLLCIHCLQSPSITATITMSKPSKFVRCYLFKRKNLAQIGKT